VDKPRNIAGRKRIIRIITIIAVVAVVGGFTWGVSKLKPAAPTVEAGTLYPDSVKRGEMVIEVRGLGTLVNDDSMLVPSLTDGRIAQRFLLAGTMVKADTTIFQMSNPDLELSAVDAENVYKSSIANLASLKAKLESGVLDQRSTAAGVKSSFETAKVQYETDAQLAKDGLISELIVRQDKVKMDGFESQYKIELERVSVNEASMKAQIDSQLATIDQLKADADIKKHQVGALTIKAGVDGTVAQLMVEVGQQVVAGTTLAKIVQPRHLKAALAIPETQANLVQIGQKASIDTRNGIIEGHVMRIDPSSINSTVTVDVKLDGELPDGARPDLSVDGVIEIQHLTNVLYVGRPVHGQPNSTITLFKYEPTGDEAVRTIVKIGRTSVNTVEILGGLKEGDKVILSDMSAQDGVDRIRLK
jgi:HlyD family secretion protein